VFGLFGSFTSSATVTAMVTSCTAGTATPYDVCVVNLTNTGTSNVAVTACSIQIAGLAAPGTPTSAGTLTVPASSSLSVTCSPTPPATAGSETVGSMAVGQFSMSNGASVPFSGTWS
jgi:hypothetical protein